MHHSLSVLAAAGYLSRFCFPAIVNKAAMVIPAGLFGEHMYSVFSGLYLGRAYYEP